MSALTQTRRPCTVNDLALIMGQLRGLALDGLEVSALLTEIDEAAQESEWRGYSSLDLGELSGQVTNEVRNIRADCGVRDDSWKRREDAALGWGVL